MCAGGYWLVSSALNLSGVPINLDVATDPRAALGRDRRAAITVGVASGGMAAAMAGLIPGFIVASVEAGIVCSQAHRSPSQPPSAECWLRWIGGSRQPDRQHGGDASA